jgi:hypothetical protein
MRGPLESRRARWRVSERLSEVGETVSVDSKSLSEESIAAAGPAKTELGENEGRPDCTAKMQAVPLAPVFPVDARKFLSGFLP